MSAGRPWWRADQRAWEHSGRQLRGPGTARVRPPRRSAIAKRGEHHHRHAPNAQATTPGSSVGVTPMQFRVVEGDARAVGSLPQAAGPTSSLEPSNVSTSFDPEDRRTPPVTQGAPTAAPHPPTFGRPAKQGLYDPRF